MSEAAIYSTFIIRQILAFVASRGLHPREILRSVGLEESAFTDPGLRLPGHYEGLIFKEAARRLDHSALPLHLAKEAKVMQIGRYSLSANSVKNTLERLAWVMDMIPDTHRIEMNLDGDALHITVRAVLPDWDTPSRIEFRLLRVLTLIRAVGGQKVTPRAVAFKMAPPEYAEIFSPFFNAPVRFRHYADMLIIDSALLELPSRTASPETSRETRIHLVHFFGRSSAPLTMFERVYAALASLLRQGRSTIGATASLMKMKPRTLQHHLQAQGTTFRILLDTQRRDYAREMLSESQLSVTLIAERLGYRDVRSLQKAFQRWEACSPQHYRQLSRAEPNTHR